MKTITCPRAEKQPVKAATAVINCEALRHNLQCARQRAPQSNLMAVVKANAYGHGLLETARTLQDADCYGVARLDEALMLRAGGIKKPILLLEGFFPAEDLSVLVDHHLQTVVHNDEQLTALEQAKLAHPIQVWMKLDTGMHRLGVCPDEAEAFYQRLSACHNVAKPINIMSHFSRADELNNPTAATTHQLDCFTTRQLDGFKAFVADKPQGGKSIAASAGILLCPDSHYNWVRPGIMLYGVSPQAECPASSFGLKPAMMLKSSLIAVRKLKAGEPVGYGGTWVSQCDTHLGVVAIGYGDGYPRSAPSGTPLWINGREVSIAGRVSMDMITVDLGANVTDKFGNAIYKVGDEVILWGNNELPVEKVSAYVGTSAYELITALTSRVALEYLNDEVSGKIAVHSPPPLIANAVTDKPVLA